MQTVSILLMGKEWLTIDISFVDKFRVDANLNVIYVLNKRILLLARCALKACFEKTHILGG